MNKHSRVQAIAAGGWKETPWHAELLVDGDEQWHCEHEHETRSGAVQCAVHARGLAYGVFIPEPPQAQWEPRKHKSRRRTPNEVELANYEMPWGFR